MLLGPWEWILACPSVLLQAAGSAGAAISPTEVVQSVIPRARAPADPCDAGTTNGLQVRGFVGNRPRQKNAVPLTQGAKIADGLGQLQRRRLGNARHTAGAQARNQDDTQPAAEVTCPLHGNVSLTRGMRRSHARKLPSQLLRRLAKHTGMMVDVFFTRGRGHQRHVMEGREQDAAVHAIKMQESFQSEIHGIVGFRTIFRGLGRKQILGAASQASNVPG